MDFDTPIWHKVLKHFIEKGYVENGLTIPFLCGTHIFSEQKAPLTIEHFWESLYQSENSFMLSFCDTIGEFIISNQDNKKKAKPTIKNLATFDDKSESVLRDDNLFAELMKHYASLIASKKFSIFEGVWGFYSKKQEKGIVETIS